MKTHELKCDTKFFGAVQSGEKPFEMRENDRDFKVGDYLILREGELRPNGYDDYIWHYLGPSVVMAITYILDNEAFYGVPRHWVILGLKKAI